MDLETKLAKIQWTPIQNRDSEKTYNKYPLRKLSKLMPDIDWSQYLKASQLTSKVNY